MMGMMHSQGDRPSVALETKELCKRFGSTLALDSVSLSLRYGSIHALLGENGAGKTSLVSAVYGLYLGIQVLFLSMTKRCLSTHPRMRCKRGLVWVQQHFSLIRRFTVLDNLILGNEPNRWCRIQRKSATAEIQEFLEKYELSLPMEKRVEELTVGECQRWKSPAFYAAMPVLCCLMSRLPR